MNQRPLSAIALGIAVLTACDKIPTDLSIGGDHIPPIEGSTVINVPQDFTCGETLTDPQGLYTITTSGTQEACKFTFVQDVTALAAADYAKIPGIEGAQVVKRVDLEVTTLAVVDATTGQDLPLETRLIDFSGTAFGDTILTKQDLTTPVPFTRSVEGAALDALKSQVQAQSDLVLPVNVLAVVNLTPEPPGQIGLEFDAQPSLVVGF